ncbi:putative wall-associated receptor kinase-like 16 [Cornus florida]|uniref:putative wall-associated receptor kinase-like 16 n=1 Tax=Cornus florida TaxID=4283 RepID=UPI00289A7A47|nr:putative wall-associated receptor kinase-like 16 [Cornus florida]
MTVHKMLPLFLLLTVSLAAIAATPTSGHGLPGCQPSCGNLTIPYPFGIGKGCYLDESFLITCDDHSNKPFLGTNNISVLNISLNGELRVSSPIAYDCHNKSVRPGNRDTLMRQVDYSISYTRNNFTAIGCDTSAYLKNISENKYLTGCMSTCVEKEAAIDGSCFGIGCCQTPIPQGVSDFNLSVLSMYHNPNDHSTMEFSPCSFAFVVEEGKYDFSTFDLYNLSNIEELPLVLDWAIRGRTCEEAREDTSNYACGNNSRCYNSDNILGYRSYRCNCSEGYQGNPYLPNGCQDINECLSPELNMCTNVCHNTEGNFTCSCPKGYHGDGKRNGKGCVANEIWLKVTVGIGIAILVLVVACSWLYWGIKKRNLVQLKEKFFRKNGGLILQEQLSRIDSSVEAAKIFTIEELKKATNNFDGSRIIGRGGFGIVYKGVLPQNKVVAIKKSSRVDQSQLDQFVNEVIVLSQINHRNVVKILGCCLETEVPLLVYEFITNGTLYHHIHEVSCTSSVPWEIRLRVAKETAEALSYLHSAASIPIIHRDVKSTNILLDNNFTAKVSDFGASRLIPLDKTQLTTMVQGTLGYLDPEYFYSSQLSEKSDVYSFGVVLVELLTGRKAISFERPENERNLATCFICSMKENRLSLILDDRIVNEGNVNQMREVANLAKSCLRYKGDERPSMREVAMELEGLTRVEKHLWAGVDADLENELLLGNTLEFCSTTTTVGFSSLENQTAVSGR